MRALIGLVLLLTLLSSVGAAWAQMTPATTAASTAPDHGAALREPLSPEAARALIARLSDAEVRQVLLDRLDAAAERRTETSGSVVHMAGQFEGMTGRIRTGLAEMAAAVPRIPAEVFSALDRFRDGRPWHGYFILVGIFALMMVVGAAAEWFYIRLMGSTWRQAAAAKPDSTLQRFGYLVLRLGLEALAIGVFLIAAFATYMIFYQGHQPTRTVVLSYLAAVAGVRGFAMFSRFLVSPKVPSLRLTSVGDDDARFFHQRSIAAASIVGFGFLTCFLLQSFGVSEAVHINLTTLVGLVLTATLVDTIRRSRQAISADIRGPAEDVSRARAAYAELWPTFTAWFVVVLYVLIILASLAGIEISYVAGIGTLIVVLFLPHLDAPIERAARLRATSGEQSDQFRVVVMKALRIVLLIGATLFVFQAWGLNIFDLTSQGVGAKVGGALFDIGATLLLAYLLWEMARITIDRKLAEEEASGPALGGGSGDMGGQGASRLSTLLPLIRRTLQVTIFTIAVMIVLSALGVDIGPLLAGAGVVGLAVGFGAQTLVRDIVSGVFFLMDDAFRLGEYIDVGSVKGTVERISIRSLRLRHHRGPLHTIPFGEITHLTNYSRDWVIMKLEFRVEYDTDLVKVKRIFKRIGQELLEHEELGPGFIEPFKSQGVKEMQDSAIIVRGKFMAKPGEQFMIRKEIYQRVQKAFAENDIHFAHRRVAVDLPPGLDTRTAQAVETAALAAASSDEAEPKPAT